MDIKYLAHHKAEYVDQRVVVHACWMMLPSEDGPSYLQPCGDSGDDYHDILFIDSPPKGKDFFLALFKRFHGPLGEYVEADYVGVITSEVVDTPNPWRTEVLMLQDVLNPKIYRKH